MLNFLLYDGLLAYFLFVLFTWEDTLISKGSFMQTKNLFVFIHIRNKSEVGTIKLVKPSSIFY